MSHLDNQRRLYILGTALFENKPLLDSERQFLAHALLKIGAGEDANKVFST